MKDKTLKRPRVGTLIAALALVLALGGTATAAKTLITGKDIKKNTITSKNVKNKTLQVADLSKKAVSSLRGQQGPKGEKGEKGDPGQPGPAGLNGVVAPIVIEGNSQNIPADAFVATAVSDLPAGRYYVTAVANVFSNGGDDLAECTLDTGDEGLDSAQWRPSAASTRNRLALQGVTGAGAESIGLSCSTGSTNGSVYGASIIAIPVQ